MKAISPLLVVVLSFGLYPQCRGVNVTDGLIHLWSFNETGGNIVADSVGNVNLQTVNGATLGAGGIFGSGALLDGTNDYLASVTSPEDFTRSDFTLSVWVKFASYSGKPGLLQFVNGGGGLHVDWSANEVAFVYGELGNFQGSATVENGVWHLFTLVQAGNRETIYIDQTAVGSGPMVSKPVSLGTLMLGRNDITHFFGGTVDDLAIYGRALSPNEIAANVVPEPATASLLGFAGLLLGGARARKYCGVTI